MTSPFGAERCKRNAQTIAAVSIIGIVSILMAILLPALKTASDEAKRISCASNMRQLHLCWMNYISDNDGGLPAVRTQVWNNITVTALGMKVWPKIMSAQLYPAVQPNLTLKAKTFLFCPSMRINTSFSWDPQYITYGMSSCGIGGWSGGKTPYRNISQVRNPSQQGAFGDSYYTTPGFNPNVGNSELGAGLEAADFRHNASCNFVYCDGHVEAKNILIKNGVNGTALPFGNE